MDPTSPTQPTNPNPVPPPPPWKAPHTPIADHETNPTPPPARSTLFTVLTLFSIVILLSIVALTGWLFWQNRIQKPQILTQEPSSKVEQANPTAIPSTLTTNQKLIQKYGAICKRFTSIEEALEEVEVACELDLSNQNLTKLPNDIEKLTNLSNLNLSNNNLISFPTVFSLFPHLVSLDLSNNELTDIDLAMTPQKDEKGSLRQHPLQTVILTGNRIDEDKIKEIKQANPNLTIEL